MNDVVAADVLAAWASGVAGAGALVAWWRIVGPGYLWLAAGVAALLGMPAALLDVSAAAVVAMVAVAGVAVLARNATHSAVSFAVGAVGFGWAASGSGVVAAVTGAVFLGGVTSEMLLGHWYLVDPRLPRSALFRLDSIALVGLAAEIGYLGTSGVFAWAEADAVLGWTFIVMAIASALLLAAVHFALREPAYSAVMAATGLSYLAVLTALGTSVVGRIVLEGVA